MDIVEEIIYTSKTDHQTILLDTNMQARRDSQQTAILTALRLQLRQHGWTIKAVAQHLGSGEATVKRWLGGKALTIDRLEQMAALCGLTLADLVHQSEQPSAHLSDQLTLAQEKALSNDHFLSFLFMVILGGYTWQEVERDFDIPPPAMEFALARLEKLALIDRLQGGRVRARINHNIVWRKAPMRTVFETTMKPQFMAMDFAAPDAIYASDIHKLSDLGAATLAEVIERHRRELHALAEADRHQSSLPRKWYAVLNAVRPLDTAGLPKGV